LQIVPVLVEGIELHVPADPGDLDLLLGASDAFHVAIAGVNRAVGLNNEYIGSTVAGRGPFVRAHAVPDVARIRDIPELLRGWTVADHGAAIDEPRHRFRGAAIDHVAAVIDDDLRPRICLLLGEEEVALRRLMHAPLIEVQDHDVGRRLGRRADPMDVVGDWPVLGGPLPGCIGQIEEVMRQLRQLIVVSGVPGVFQDAVAPVHDNTPRLLGCCSTLTPRPPPWRSSSPNCALSNDIVHRE
jgi:hypothetical protein